MCCFSPVSAPLGLIGWLLRRRARSVPVHVAATRIFARMIGSDEQALIYSMRLSVAGDVAMILPVPVVSGAGDHALRFVELDGYPTLFDDMKRGFPDLEVQVTLMKRGGFSLPHSRPKLVVYDVGSFVASYVPSRGDFDRLDPRFRLPDSVWQAMRRYDDWGFAVFQLKRGKQKEVHPMAFRFRTREPARLFLPTVHVHDGTFHPTATFDHDLYYQHPSLSDPLAPSRRDQVSRDLASSFVRIADTKDLVDGNQVVGRRQLHGVQPNEDVWIDEPGLDRAVA